MTATSITHDCILIVRDRSGATTDHVLHDLKARSFAAHLLPIVAKDAVLVSDGRDAYGTFAHAEGILHIPIIASRGEHVYEGFHIQNVNGYTSRLIPGNQLIDSCCTAAIPVWGGP